MMQVYIKVNTNVKGKTIAFTKCGNIHLFHSSTWFILHWITETLQHMMYKWHKQNPPIKNKRGSKNLVLTPWVTSRITSYQATR
jgi:hypothetical protein